MKVNVVQAYKDKYDKTLHKAGETIDIAKGRFEEINSTAHGIFVEEIVEKESKKSTAKK